MKILTTVQTPENAEYKGLVVTNKVKSRNIVSNIGAGFKSIVGGNIGGLTKLTSTTRTEVINQLKKDAKDLGANAIYGFRLNTTSISSDYIDIVAYGTAVKEK